LRRAQGLALPPVALDTSTIHISEHQRNVAHETVEEVGFEPASLDPQSSVLPLNYSPDIPGADIEKARFSSSPKKYNHTYQVWLTVSFLRSEVERFRGSPY
jgi:hypothetical protein